MQRPLVLLSAVLGLCAPALAAQQVSIGVKAGASAAHFLAGFLGEDQYSYPARKAVAISGNLTVQLGPVVGVRVEAMALDRGSVGGVDMRIHYVEFPLLLRLSWPRPVLGVTAAVLMGAAWARETGCHLVVWGVPGIPEDPRPASPHSEDCIEWRQTGLDFGVVGGLELERALPVGRLSIELRHTRGTRDLASAYGCCSLYHRTWTLTLGYAVDLFDRRLPN